MTKYLFILLILTNFVFGQTEIENDSSNSVDSVKNTTLEWKKVFFTHKKHRIDSLKIGRITNLFMNEVVFDLLNVAIYQNFNFSYERLFKNNQGLIIIAKIGDSHVNGKTDYSSIGIGLGYNFYFSQSKNKGLYLGPAIFGRKNHSENEWIDFSNSYVSKNNYFAAGFNMGYKYILKNRIVIKAEFEIIRNLFVNQSNTFHQLVNSGQAHGMYKLNLGYRF